jgi:hypothetical protein
MDAAGRRVCASLKSILKGSRGHMVTPARDLLADSFFKDVTHSAAHGDTIHS